MRNTEELQKNSASSLEFKQHVHYHCFCISPHHRHSTAIAQNTNTIHDTAYCFDFILIFPMVPGAGLEPAQRERRGILNPLCLPIPPSGLGKKVEARSGVEPD